MDNLENLQNELAKDLGVEPWEVAIIVLCVMFAISVIVLLLWGYIYTWCLTKFVKLDKEPGQVQDRRNTAAKSGDLTSAEIKPKIEEHEEAKQEEAENFNVD